MTADDERAAVVAWLRDRSLDIKSPATELPFIWGFLWAISHPVRFEAHRSAFYALMEAERAIEAGAHREGEGK